MNVYSLVGRLLQASEIAQRVKGCSIILYDFYFNYYASKLVFKPMALITQL